MLQIILLYAMIFILKIIEVSMATFRIILITKGEKKIGSFIAFFEVCLWLFLVSTVLVNIQEDMFKAFVYALGFATGQFVGSVIEDKIGVGTVRIEAIVLRQHEKALSKHLRDLGYAVTVFEGNGMKFPRSLLLMVVKRRKQRDLIESIKGFQENVVLTVEDVSPVYGGFSILRKKK